VGVTVQSASTRPEVELVQVVEAKFQVVNKAAITARHLVATDEDFTFASSTRLQELERGQSELRGQVKILEARNMRLQTENTKLNEVARQAQEVLTEGAKVEKKARKEAAAKVESRSQREVETVAVIAEQTAAEPAAKTNDQAEKTDGNLFTEWQRLAGVKTAK
jgi:vacuolar-type H+-ATPase subunit I/STV1